jgi:hypothetical protein
MDRNHVPTGQNHDGGPGGRRLAAVLLVAGVVVSFAAGALHQGATNDGRVYGSWDRCIWRLSASGAGACIRLMGGGAAWQLQARL